MPKGQTAPFPTKSFFKNVPFPVPLAQRFFSGLPIVHGGEPYTAWNFFYNAFHVGSFTSEYQKDCIVTSYHHILSLPH